MQTHDDHAPRCALALRALMVLVASLAMAACGDSGGASAQGQKSPPLSVQAMIVHPQVVPVYDEFPGRVQGRQTAKVIGQVTGVLESKNYNEGSLVHKGDLLFKIDAKPYQATVNQRKANLASAKANLANATRAWERTRKLYKANAVSRAARDQDLANYQSAKAAVQQARADLESAQIDLNYTTVKAPISGVTSLRDVDIGSLVTANQTQLTTITQLNPVYVLFALPENDAFARQQAQREMGKQSSNASTREATIILKSGDAYPRKGEVDFTQSTVDPDTGTVQLRAIVKNPNNVLMPGRYVRVRVRIQTLSNAIVIPEKAIFTGQSRTYVFVAQNGKAKKQFVTLGPDVANGRAITKGLSAGDSVIVSGLGQVKPGASIQIANKAKQKHSKQRQAKDGQAQSQETASPGARNKRDHLKMAGARELAGRAFETRHAS